MLKHKKFLRDGFIYWALESSENLESHDEAIHEEAVDEVPSEDILRAQYESLVAQIEDRFTKIERHYKGKTKGNFSISREGGFNADAEALRDIGEDNPIIRTTDNLVARYTYLRDIKEDFEKKAEANPEAGKEFHKGLKWVLKEFNNILRVGHSKEGSEDVYGRGDLYGFEPLSLDWRVAALKLELDKLKSSPNGTYLLLDSVEKERKFEGQVRQGRVYEAIWKNNAGKFSRVRLGQYIDENGNWTEPKTIDGNLMRPVDLDQDFNDIMNAISSKDQLVLLPPAEETTPAEEEASPVDREVVAEMLKPELETFMKPFDPEKDEDINRVNELAANSPNIGIVPPGERPPEEPEEYDREIHASR